MVCMTMTNCHIATHCSSTLFLRLSKIDAVEEGQRRKKRPSHCCHSPPPTSSMMQQLAVSTYMEGSGTSQWVWQWALHPSTDTVSIQPVHSHAPIGSSLLPPSFQSGYVCVAFCSILSPPYVSLCLTNVWTAARGECKMTRKTCEWSR